MNRPVTIYWRRGLAALSVVLAGIFSAIYLTLATETGTRWALQQAEQYLPIRIDVAKGNLINGLAISSIEFHNESLTVKAQNSIINLDLWLLLFNQQLKLSELSSESIEVKTAQNETTPETAIPSLPSLPFDIEIKRLKFERIQFNALEPISLFAERLNLTQQTLSWQSVVYAIQNLSLQSHGSWHSGNIKPSLKTTIDWQHENISGSLSAQGTLNKLQLTHDASLEDFHIHSSGIAMINRLDDIDLELDNELSPLRLGELNIEYANIKLKTNIRDINFSLTSQLKHPQLGSVDLTSHGQGSLSAGLIITSNIAVLRGQIVTTSHVILQPAPLIESTISAQNLHLQDSPAWPIDAPLSANIKGQFSLNLAEQLSWSIPQLTLTGTLAESPLILELAANASDQTIEISKLNAYHLSDKLAARAILNEQFLTGSGVLEVAELQRYRSTIKGDSHIEFQIATELDNWQTSNHVTLQANSKNLTLAELTIGGIDLSLQNDGHLFQATIGSDFLHQGPLALQNIKQDLQGQIYQDHINIEGTANSQLIFQGNTISLPPMVLNAFWQEKGYQQAEIKLMAEDENLQLKSLIGLARNQQLNGEVELHSPHLQWLKHFSPRIKNVAGQITTKSQLTGSADKPNIDTKLDLNIADIDIIDPNISLQAIQLRGDLNSDGKLRFDGTAQQKGRPINIEGRGWLIGENTPRVAVHIDAQKLSANTPKIEVAISPDIDIDYVAQQLSVKGSLSIPSADIEVSQLPNPSFNLSPDVVVVGRKVEPSEAGLAHNIDLDVIIEDNTVVKAAGLATKLKGKLHYKSQTNRTDYVQGKLEMIDGRLNSSGQDLYIKKGELIFTGTPDNPSLDIIAMRKITSPELEVGIHITGTVKNMKTEITSLPMIDSSRALSFLAFGKDITQESEASDSNAQLMSAAINLGIGQSSQLIQNLRRSTGLDELAAIANDSGSASLIAGKQLSTKLFARYRYDMAEALGVLMLRYSINQQWSIEAESGNDTSVDVLYRLND